MTRALKSNACRVGRPLRSRNKYRFSAGFFLPPRFYTHPPHPSFLFLAVAVAGALREFPFQGNAVQPFTNEGDRELFSLIWFEDVVDPRGTRLTDLTLLLVCHEPDCGLESSECVRKSREDGADFYIRQNNQQQMQVMTLLLNNDNNADTAGALFSS